MTKYKDCQKRQLHPSCAQHGALQVELAMMCSRPGA